MTTPDHRQGRQPGSNRNDPDQRDNERHDITQNDFQLAAASTVLPGATTPAE